MNLERAFRLLTVALVLMGVAAFETGAGSPVFFVASLVACVGYYRNDRSPRPRVLPNWAANAICLTAFMVTVFLVYGVSGGGRYDGLAYRVPVVGRYLTIVQWVLLFKPRGNREYAWVYFISLTHLAGSALLIPELPFAWLYLGYVSLAVAALVVYEHKCQLEASGGTLASSRERVRLGFFARCVAGALGLLLPVAFFFAVLPRGHPGALSQITRRSVQPITGFSDTVRLGDLARIQTSSVRVMQVRVTDKTGKPVAAEGLLMRGVALDRYDGRRWLASADVQQVAESQGTPIRFYYGPARGKRMPERQDYVDRAPLLRCEVTLEPIASRALFAPFAMVSVTLPKGERMVLRARNESIRSARYRRGTLRYAVESRLVGAKPPEPTGRGGRTAPRRPRRGSPFLQLPESLPERVRQLARRVARMDENPSEYERAIRIRDYLSDPTNFRYTLNLRSSGTADPIDRFLFDAQEGNCEYFASAMAVLLRCVGVETRLVNGFKSGEWNNLSECLVFRQQDAHSWVEANVFPVGWTPLDPSPPAGDALPDRPGQGTLGAFRRLADHLDRLWVEYVVGFDRGKQKVFYRFLRKPKQFMHVLLTEALWRFLGDNVLLRDNVRDAVAEMARRSRRAVTGLAIVAACALALLVALKLRRVLRRKDGSSRRGATVGFYADLLRLLRRRGFPKPDHLTPAEFARRVVAAGGVELAAVEDLTWRFYGVRFGGRELSGEEEQEAARRIRDLSDALDRLRRRRRAQAKASGRRGMFGAWRKARQRAGRRGARTSGG